MKLIRWLLSNLILIVVILALVYVYVYWDDLAGEDTPAGKVIASLSAEYSGVREFVEAIRERNATDVADEQPAGEEAPAAAADTADAGTEVAGYTEAPAAEQALASEDRFVSPEIEQALNRVDADGKLLASETPTDEVEQPMSAHPPGAVVQAMPPAAQPQPYTNTPMPPAAQAYAYAPPPMPVQTPTPAQAQATETPAVAGASGIDAETRALWLEARRAFRKRDFETCISDYQKLIADHPGNMDAYGELGNVYFNQGDRKQAAAAYYEAAAIMIKQGQVRRAASLSGLMRHLDEEKSRQLKELLDNAAQQPNSAG